MTNVVSLSLFLRYLSLSPNAEQYGIITMYLFSGSMGYSDIGYGLDSRGIRGMIYCRDISHHHRGQTRYGSTFIMCQG